MLFLCFFYAFFYAFIMLFYLCFYYGFLRTTRFIVFLGSVTGGDTGFSCSESEPFKLPSSPAPAPPPPPSSSDSESDSESDPSNAAVTEF